MARPRKCRKVCALPDHTTFIPFNNKEDRVYGRVVITVDEYETIRIIDLLERTQEECAAKMGIARTTVQAIYISARRKIADCIVNGKCLVIEGGDIVLCNGMDMNCSEKKCCRKTKKTEV